MATTSGLDCLGLVLNTRRAPTLRKVYVSLLEGEVAARDIAHKWGLTENAVNIALHELVRASVVERPLRGRYCVNMTLLALHLCDQVKALEERARRR